jgi:hypothetical protein
MLVITATLRCDVNGRQRKREVFIQSQTVSRKVVLSEELAAKKALSRT